MRNVSRETQEKLLIYTNLIRKWNPHINLVAPASLAQLEHRHIEDCRQLADLSAQKGGSWVDLGSGGGLPGLVLTIERPEISVTMVESDQRKTVFLRTVIREAGLENAGVINDRIENITPLEADHISARALAPLPQLMAYVFQHMAPDGTAWLMKGKNWQAEVDLARKIWSFDLESHQSKTNPDAAILEIKRIHHV